MPTVAAGSTASHTFTAPATVVITFDPNEEAVVAVSRGGRPLFGQRMATSRSVGPFQTGDVLTLTASRGAVDYEVFPYVAPAAGTVVSAPRTITGAGPAGEVINVASVSGVMTLSRGAVDNTVTQAQLEVVDAATSVPFGFLGYPGPSVRRFQKPAGVVSARINVTSFSGTGSMLVNLEG